MYPSSSNTNVAAPRSAPTRIPLAGPIINAASIALAMSLLSWGVLVATTIFFLTNLSANMGAQQLNWTLGLLGGGMLLSLALSFAGPILAAIALIHRRWNQTATSGRQAAAIVALVLGILAIPSALVIAAWIFMSALFIGG